MRFTAAIAAGLLAAGLLATAAQAQTTDFTFSTTLTSADTFDGVRFTTPTTLSVDAQFPSDYSNYLGLGYYGVMVNDSTTLTIAGLGTFTATTPLVSVFTDVNFAASTGSYLGGLLNGTFSAGFADYYSTETPTIDFITYPAPLPSTVALTDDLGRYGEATPFVINFTSGDTLVIGAPVPEPATLALLGAGLAGLAAARRRA